MALLPSWNGVEPKVYYGQKSMGVNVKREVARTCPVHVSGGAGLRQINAWQLKSYIIRAFTS
jgi:hypothetical protein